MGSYDLGTIALAPAAPQLGSIALVAQSDVMLSAEEARQIVKNINGRFEQSRKDLMELEDREGWRALGYDSWRACVMAEFTQSVATLYRQLEAAKIEREIFGVSQLETPTPTAQLQAVKHLPAEQKRAAFKRADQLAGDQPRTAKHIAQAAAEVSAPDLPPDYSIVQRRLAAHGIALSTHPHGTGLAFVTKREGMTGIVTPTWSNVIDRLERLESEPPPPSASASASDIEPSGRAQHIARERADDAILADVARLIAQARQLLDTLQVSQWRARPLAAAVVRERARLFAHDQRDRLTRFSLTAMISQTTFNQSLDHIDALVDSQASSP